MRVEAVTSHTYNSGPNNPLTQQRVGGIWCGGKTTHYYNQGLDYPAVSRSAWRGGFLLLIKSNNYPFVRELVIKLRTGKMKE